MEFCSKCGCVLIQDHNNSKCPRCQQTSNKKLSLETSEKRETKSEVAVIDENTQDIHAIMDAKCKKCENDKAYFWIKQTRSSDEAATRFFRCTKCRYTWREYR